MTQKPIEVSVVDHVTPFFLKLNERAKAIVGDLQVTVKNDKHHNSKLSVYALATIHTKGSKIRNIPARPFIAPALRGKTMRYLTYIARQTPLMLLGRTNSGEVMDDVGAMAVEDVMDYIDHGTFAPLKPATIKRKGHAEPLIETKQLKNSIIAVRKGGRNDGNPWRGG